MSVLQYEVGQSSALFQYDASGQDIQPSQPKMLGVSVLIGFLPAAFWASVAWLLWGWVGAVIATIVALVGWLFIVGLLRSSSGIETPMPAHRAPDLRPVA